MTRETKVGLVVAGSFLCLVCIVVASKMNASGDPSEPQDSVPKPPKNDVAAVAQPKQGSEKPNGERQAPPAAPTPPTPQAREINSAPNNQPNMPVNVVPSAVKTPEQAQKDLEDVLRRQKQEKQRDPLVVPPALVSNQPAAPAGPIIGPDGKLTLPTPETPVNIKPAPMGGDLPKAPMGVVAVPDRLPGPQVPPPDKNFPAPIVAPGSGPIGAKPVDLSPPPPIGKDSFGTSGPQAIPAPGVPIGKDSFPVAKDSQAPGPPKGNDSPFGPKADPIGVPPPNPAPVQAPLNPNPPGPATALPPSNPVPQVPPFGSPSNNAPQMPPLGFPPANTGPQVPPLGSPPANAGPQVPPLGSPPANTGPQVPPLGSPPANTPPQVSPFGSPPSNTPPQVPPFGPPPPNTVPRVPPLGSPPVTAVPQVPPFGLPPGNVPAPAPSPPSFTNTPPAPNPIIGPAQLPSTPPIVVTPPGTGSPIPTVPAVPAIGLNALPPVRSVEPDVVKVRPGETNFSQLSKRLYNDPKYADALQAFNRDHWRALADGQALSVNQPVLNPDQQIMNPPLGILERDYAKLIGNGAPNAVVPVMGTTPAPRPTPVVPSAAPVAQTPGYYVVQTAGGEGIRDIARRVLGNADRWTDLYRANPTLQPQYAIPQGTQLKLP